MDEALIRLHAAPVPRYTSYPTAPNFNSDMSAGTYRQWLGELAPGSTLSLYIHIPFCDRLCWFCACNTKHTRSYDPVARYLGSLHAEVATVGALVAGRAQVTAVHLGGGSPTMLRPDDLVRLSDALRSAFAFRDGAEISVELDPSDMNEDGLDALGRIGMTRASLGVQDFDPKVQQAINRIQTFEQTKWAVDGVRARGARSVNVDALYGLPHQSVEGFAATLRQLLALSPDRIALFGYAHVPWFKKHQTMIDEAWLPDAVARFKQFAHAAHVLGDAGYQQIGLDHFARPDDAMAVAARQGRLSRNFQGYTVDPADALIGLGASAIGRLPQGHVQNAPATPAYERMIAAEGLAACRGFAMSDEDRMRGWVIERLMCDFALSRPQLGALYGAMAEPLLAEADRLAESDRDGLIVRDGDRFVVTERGRPFVRSLASAFDAYLPVAAARHSAGV